MRGANPSECGRELRRLGGGRRGVAETFVIRSKVRSGAGGLRAARRAHLVPTVTVTRRRQSHTSSAPRPRFSTLGESRARIRS